MPLHSPPELKVSQSKTVVLCCLVAVEVAQRHERFGQVECGCFVEPSRPRNLAQLSPAIRRAQNGLQNGVGPNQRLDRRAPGPSPLRLHAIILYCWISYLRVSVWFRPDFGGIDRLT